MQTSIRIRSSRSVQTARVEPTGDIHWSFSAFLKRLFMAQPTVSFFSCFSFAFLFFFSAGYPLYGFITKLSGTAARSIRVYFLDRKSTSAPPTLLFVERSRILIRGKHSSQWKRARGAQHSPGILFFPGTDPVFSLFLPPFLAAIDRQKKQTRTRTDIEKATEAATSRM